MPYPFTTEESLNPPVFKLWSEEKTIPSGSYPKADISFTAEWPVRSQEIRVAIPYLYIVGDSGGSLAITVPWVKNWQIGFKMTADGDFISPGPTMSEASFISLGALPASTYWNAIYDFSGCRPDGGRDGSGMNLGGSAREFGVANYFSDAYDFGVPNEPTDGAPTRKKHFAVYPVRCFGFRMSGSVGVSASYSSWPTSQAAILYIRGGIWAF